MSARTLLFVATTLLCLSLALAKTNNNKQQLDKVTLKRFNDFQAKYKFKCKKGTKACKEKKQTFAANQAIIDKHNADPNAKYKLGPTKFMDWSREEKKKVVMDLKRLKALPLRNRTTEANTRRKREDLGTFDWRTRNVVNPIRDQGECGACWAFASVAAIEIQANWENKRFNDDQRSFSEQYLIDCSVEGNGCDGGWPETAIDWAKTNGLATAAQAPFQQAAGTCEKLTVARPVIGWKDLTNKPGPAAMYVRNTGPITSAFMVCEDFYYYTGGVYTRDCQPSDEDYLGGHGVAIIGFGTSEDGIDYWLARNQWSTDWGLDGYFMIERGKDTSYFESFGLTGPRTTLVL